ncbi:MAG TPA: carboxylesterase family protein [Alphaproteobacteria bacterium]|nr:carboxylesterase family protein [Alphaproteobacteria bacterium]
MGDTPFATESNRRKFLKQAAITGGVSALAASLPLGKQAFAFSSYLEGPVVEVEGGKMRGLIGKDVHIFRGIRYGAPTGGANRFMPPKKPQGWLGVWDAFDFGPSAPQSLSTAPKPKEVGIGTDPAGTPQNEDCLRLNVYTKGVDAAGKRPVMVFFHGGGYSSGSGSINAYQGENLARSQDVVLVTINHRLNVFGYTYLGDVIPSGFETSGNAGMLDCVRALEWIRDNIASFGGDPGNVTIFGESGGGMKVSWLMAAPSAKGLFHKAIIESGPGLAMGRPEATEKGTMALLDALGISKDKARDLQMVPQDKLFAAYGQALRKLGGGFGGGGAFSPIVDGVSLLRDPFTPDATPESADVALMIGTNRTEMSFFMRGPAADVNMTDDGLKQRLAKTPNFNPKKVDAVVKAYRKDFPDASPWKLYLIMSSDGFMRAGSITLADRKSAQKAPVYMYLFDWETPLMGGHMYTMHTLELPFVFGSIKKATYMVPDTPETQGLSDNIMSAWASFARSGNPNTPKLPHWPAYTAKSRETMILNVKSHVEKNPNHAARMAYAEATKRT